MRFFLGACLTRKGSPWKRLLKGFGKGMRVVALAQGMLRRQRGESREKEYREQREDGVTAASWTLSRLSKEQQELLSP